ncbi:RNA polymerase sigma factor SigD [Rubripirellula tenax]|uniref:RNA polymerase sigma factor SigD n=1 Tax=Rubripirellula tenax TaxID=2528015 RepID=A0A5C6F5E5_9BACT|nr:sigma-70 family RNA polymerase sigma factor [Rubripirellula tenax]TWU56455.1 RNA polymerase sigma factor SigD [Rubripirellula tenax]
MTQKTRLSLLDELKNAGSEPAWRDFCGIYEQLIERWLLKEELQHADIDDLRQEVMATVVTELPKFDHNGRTGAFRRWLRLIVANRLNRKWEKKSREQKRLSPVNFSSIAEQLADDTSRMSVVWDQEHNQFVLNRMLNSIAGSFPETHVVAFRRITIGGESAQAVADDLGMSLGAVRVAQHRILKVLRQTAGELID